MATVAAAVLALAGCTRTGATSGASPVVSGTPVVASSPPSEPPNPTQAVAMAGPATTRAGSARIAFRLASRNDSGVETECFRGQGAYDFARQQGNFQVEFPSPGSHPVDLLCPPYGSTPVVLDHNVLYEKVRGFPKPWVRAEPKPDENFFNPAVAVAWLPQVSTATPVGTETLRGTATTHYRVQHTGAAGSGDVWLDGQGRVRQIVSSASGQIPFTFTFEFYDFGTPVTVTIPPPGDVHPIGTG